MQNEKFTYTPRTNQLGAVLTGKNAEPIFEIILDRESNPNHKCEVLVFKPKGNK